MNPLSFSNPRLTETESAAEGTLEADAAAEGTSETESAAEGSSAEKFGEEESAAEEAAAETAGEYKVVVYDEDRNPLADVYVQFCSDNACKYEVTDENGTAVFNEPAGTYTIHVADVPEGFEETDEEFEAPETPGTVEITLKKG